MHIGQQIFETRVSFSQQVVISFKSYGQKLLYRYIFGHVQYHYNFNLLIGSPTQVQHIQEYCLVYMSIKICGLAPNFLSLLNIHKFINPLLHMYLVWEFHFKSDEIIKPNIFCSSTTSSWLSKIWISGKKLYFCDLLNSMALLLAEFRTIWLDSVNYRISFTFTMF